MGDDSFSQPRRPGTGPRIRGPRLLGAALAVVAPGAMAPGAMAPGAMAPGAVASRAAASGAAALVAATLVALVGCTPLSPHRANEAFVAPPAPAYAAVTAPHDGRGGAELIELERFGNDPGALLRRAWLLQSNHAYEESLRPLNLVIHGGFDHSDEVEAVGRWLRARAWAGLGAPDRAAPDQARARELTSNPELLAAIDELGGRRARPRVALGDLPIVSRDAWHAAPERARGMAALGGVERVTVHHSATLARAGSASASIAAVRSIQRHHQQRNGWSDIGYHFLIDPAGRIFEGRDLRWQGAHAGDPARNRHNVGICLLGNYVPAEQGSPPRAQLESLWRLMDALCRSHGLGPDAVLTHRELRDTTCPGPYLQAEVERFRNALGGLAADR